MQADQDSMQMAIPVTFPSICVPIRLKDSNNFRMFILLQLVMCPGRVSHFWFGFGKFSQNISNFSKYAPVGTNRVRAHL